MSISRLSSIKLVNRGVSIPFFSLARESLADLLISTPPWAKYTGANILNNIIPDETGNGRDAICSGVVGGNTVSNGSDVGVTLQICKGTTASTIVFPLGSIPANDYTIAFITRYASSSSNRILTGHTSYNYILGHHSAKRGVMYDATRWTTPLNSNGNLQPINTVLTPMNNWVSMCVSTNTGIAPQHINVNSTAKGTQLITTSPTPNQLAINTNNFLEKSGFELAHIIIWDVPLTLAQMNVVVASFDEYVFTGILR